MQRSLGSIRLLWIEAPRDVLGRCGGIGALECPSFGCLGSSTRDSRNPNICGILGWIRKFLYFYVKKNHWYIYIISHANFNLIVIEKQIWIYESFVFLKISVLVCLHFPLEKLWGNRLGLLLNGQDGVMKGFSNYCLSKMVGGSGNKGQQLNPRQLNKFGSYNWCNFFHMITSPLHRNELVICNLSKSTWIVETYTSLWKQI